MKVTTIPFFSLSLTLLGGDFINLDFNSPNLSGPFVATYPGGPVAGPISQIIPGWTMTANGAIASQATYALNTQSTGALFANLNEGESNYPFGNYLFLVSRNDNDGRPGPDLWLSQTGLVPKNAEGLWVLGFPGVEGYIDGKFLGLVDPVPGIRTIWNIEAYQGKEVTLQFHVKPGGVQMLDIVGFTTVPEPSEYAMLGLGLGLVYWHSSSRARQRASKTSGGLGSTQAPSSSSTPA